MKRRFPGITDLDYKRACAVALKNRRKTFPGAKFVEKREIVAEVVKITDKFKEMEPLVVGQQVVAEETENLKIEHRCKSCGKSYVKIISLMKHIEKKHPAEVGDRFRCPVCKKKMKTKATLKQHMKTHKDKVVFQCGECSEVLHSEYKLSLHKKKQHEEKVCDKCAFRGTGKEVEIHQHNKHRSGNQTVNETCPKCAKVFKSRSGWWAHKRAHSKLLNLEERTVKGDEAQIHSKSQTKTPSTSTTPTVSVASPPTPEVTKQPKTINKPISSWRGRKSTKNKPAVCVPLSQYELIRASNIAQKEEKLKKLGLVITTAPAPTQQSTST